MPILPLFTVDAFSRVPFAGNQAAVCLDSEVRKYLTFSMLVTKLTRIKLGCYFERVNAHLLPLSMVAMLFATTK